MNVLFLFLDGVGLGADDPASNPFARAAMPNLRTLLGGRRLLAEAAPLTTDRATLLALDACLGVEGAPQSATGQAALLTGRNVPFELGYHYGPKPNPAVAAHLQDGNLFRVVGQSGGRAALLNAYPEAYFAAIASGRRLHAAIPLAVTNAGVALKTAADLYAGHALAADFTGQGWRERLGLADTPLLTPDAAGRRMAALAQEYDFAFFEYWLTDFAGHHQDMAAALALLDVLDQVLGGLLAAWDDRPGLILITSDHGNLEDLSIRGHTRNPVPALLIGPAELRAPFAAPLHDLTDVAPAILAGLKLLNGHPDHPSFPRKRDVIPTEAGRHSHESRNPRNQGYGNLGTRERGCDVRGAKRGTPTPAARYGAAISRSSCIRGLPSLSYAAIGTRISLCRPGVSGRPGRKTHRPSASAWASPKSWMPS